MSIKGFQIEGAVHRYDYNALDNKPVSDASLSVVGRFADAAAVGNAIAAIRKSGTSGGGSGEGVTSTRGTGIYKIVSPPVFYKANFGNFTSTYRIALATTKVQAGVTDVFVGDIIEYNIFHYPVGYVDKNYVYLGARTSIQGADGYSPTISAQKTGTETVVTIVNKDEVTTATIFDGAPGRSVTGVTEYYKVSNDYVNPPPYGEDDPPWSTDPSAESAKLTPLIRYLWNYEVIHYSDGELSAPTTPVMIGVWGDSGKDGIGISDVLNYYWANNKTHLTEAEKRIQTCNEWTIEVQTTTESNPYLWNYEEIIYSDSNKAHKVTKPCIIGHYGADGFSPIVTASKSGNATTISITDKTGTKPPVVILDGTAATTYSLINSHPAIIKAADGSFTPAAITLSAKSQTGNDTPQDYAGIFKIDVYDGSSWSYGRYVSSVEEQTTQYTIPAGTQQICCSLYLDRATTILADQEIIGVVSNGTSVTITSKSVKYQKGTSGTNAPTGEWTNEIPSNINEGEYLWTRTVVNYSDGNSTISYSVSRYATNGTSPTVTLTDVYYIQNNNGSAHPDENSSSWNPNPPSTTVPGQYVWTKTVVTYSDGATSVSYSVTRNGTDGEDAYTVILDNESHTFAGNESSAIRGSTVVTVYAYKGTDTATPIVNKNNITGMPNGMSVTSVSNSAGKAEITFDVTTSMTSRSGVITIPVTVGGTGGKVFNKLFSYSLALKGQRGIAIREVTNYYLASSQSSGVTSDDVDWTSDPTDEKAQISEQKPYLWNYEVVKGDLNQIISTTFPIIIGRYAQDGIPGTPGRGIVRIQEKYGVSSNSNTEPSTWYDEVQTTDAVNRYLWNYEIITYTSGTITQTTKKRIIGMYSKDGAPATAYSLIVSHAVVAKSASGTFSPTSITLTAKSQTGTSAPANYSGRFKIEVHNGSSWSTKYTSSSNENTKSYTIPSGTTQVRCSLYLAGGTSTLLDQQTVPVVSDGTSVTITSKSVKYQKGTSGTTAPTGTWGDSIPSNIGENEYLWTQTVVNYSDGNSTEAYSVSRNAADGFSPTVSSTTVEYVESTSGTNQPTSGWNPTPPSTMTPGRYMWTKTTVAYDDGGSSVSYTVSRNGSDGGDAYTVILDNESHTFAGGTSAAIAGTATVNVYAYKGATAIAPTVTKANISGLPTGMSVQSVTNDSTNKKSTIVFAVTTSMVTRSGMVTIPVVADSKTFNKEFSYSLALQGTKGDTGAKGDKGDKGDTGDRGATWYAGTGITGTSTTAKVFSGSGVSSAIVGDHYLNTSTQNVYRCTVAGAASTAKWVYEQNIKGERGTQGNKGDTGDTCYFHIKYSNDGGATFTGNSGEDAGSYIGTYSDNTEADSTSVSSYKWVKIEGDDGTSVTVSSIKYTVSTTESQPADSAFTYTTVPTVAEGRWLWTLTTYSNGSKAYTKAKQGQKGDAGTSVAVSSIKYTVTTTESQPADSAFTYNSVPTVAEGSWLWTLTTFSNGSKIYSKAKQGKAGTNGTTFTPSVDASGNISWTNDGGKTNPTAVNIKGPQGNKGDKGVGVTSITKTGTSGTVDTYTIKYTDNTSTTFTVTNGTNGTNGTSAEWFYGTALTHTSGTATATISGAKVGDMYLNTATSNVYKCTAKNVWTYAGNIADGVIDNISIGGRNLFGYGSDCQKTLAGMSQDSGNLFSIVTEDGYLCAHASGQLHKTAYLYSKLRIIPKPNEQVVISCYVKIKNIVRGTTNPMCELYFDGNTLDGHWLSTHSRKTYLDGKLIDASSGLAFDRAITDEEWHHFAISAVYYNKQYNTPILGAVYFRDATGDLYVRNIKFERGNIATDWTPAPEDVAADIESVQANLVPNLTPWFDRPLTDVYNSITNPNGYWYSTTLTSALTQLPDGWAHVDVTNSGTSNALLMRAVGRAVNGIVTGGNYTCLVEFRNVVNAAGINNFYTQQANGAQFWGDGSYDGFSISASLIVDGAKIYKPMKCVTGPTKSDTLNWLMSIASYIKPSQTVSYDFRVSLYEGDYSGPYKPYVDQDLRADVDDAKDAAETAQATADRKKQTFISTPTPPYYEGDAYFKTESGESGSAQWYVCTNTRLTAYGTGESWEDDFEQTSYALESSLQSTKTELLEEDKKIKASVEEQKKYTDGKVTPLERRTSTLEQTTDNLTIDFKREISGLKERTENNENDLSSYQKVFAFTENGLQISEQRDKIQTPSVLQIDNGKISFIVDGQEASYWSGENSMFYVGDIVVGLNKKAQFGNFAWIPRSNGNLSFRWVGSAEDNN